MSALPDRLPGRVVELVRWSSELLPELERAVQASFDELHRWMPWAVTLPTADDLRETLRQFEGAFDEDREWNYVLVEPDGSVVGAAGVHRRGDRRTLEIGYWVRTDRTGRGYATAAAEALTAAVFRSMPHIDRMRIRMDRTNTASAAIPPKLGYRRSGEVPSTVEAAGETGTDLVWEVTRTEWSRTPPGRHRQPG